MKIGKVEKLVANLYDKTEYAIHIRNIKQALTEYAIHIRNIKQALNHGLVLKKVHTVIKFDQDFFRKTMKNVRKHRDIKLVTTQRRRNYLESQPNYHTKKFFTNVYQQQKWKKEGTYE